MFIGFGTCVVDTSCLKEVAQSVGITSYEAEVTSSNPPSPSCVDMSKKKKKKKLTQVVSITHSSLLTWWHLPLPSFYLS
jgi:hypothetical protein